MSKPKTLSVELAGKYGFGTKHMNFRLAVNEALDRAETAMLALVNGDEFYDMLPGNGEDDYICGHLEKEIKTRFRAMRGNL